MRTKLTLVISILAVILSACSRNHEKESSRKDLIHQMIQLTSMKGGDLVLAMDKDDSTYYVKLNTEDKSLIVKFETTTHFYTQYVSSCEDSITGHSDQMDLYENEYHDTYFSVSEFTSDGPTKLIHHTTLDVLAKVYLSNDRFEPVARIEFIPDNYFRPKKIEKIILWEAKQVVKY
jgi:hypothetical protein